MTFDELEHEFLSELIGDKIYARVRLLATRLLRGRSPQIYARGAHDVRDGADDVLNDFVLEVLIGERQLDYVMATASDLSDFDKLVVRQLSRFLARTRMRTVVDNLIDRSVRRLRVAPFEAHGKGRNEQFALPGRTSAASWESSDVEIRRAAALAQAIPKASSSGDERAPKVYDAQALGAVLMVLCRTTTTPVTRAVLQRFFDLLLTAWVPTFLEPSAGHDQHAPSLSPDEEVVVTETATRILSGMAPDDQLIFQYKFANLPDRDVAAALGLSRQSTAPRKKLVFDRVSSGLEGLDAGLQAAVIQRINVMLAGRGVDA